MQAPGGYRNTPTPPQYHARYAAPPASMPAQSQPYQTYPNHQVTPSSALASLLIFRLTAFRHNLIHRLGARLSRRLRSNTSNTYMRPLRSSSRSAMSKGSSVTSPLSSRSAKPTSAATHAIGMCRSSSRLCCSCRTSSIRSRWTPSRSETSSDKSPVWLPRLPRPPGKRRNPAFHPTNSGRLQRLSRSLRIPLARRPSHITSSHRSSRSSQRSLRLQLSRQRLSIRCRRSWQMARSPAHLRCAPPRPRFRTPATSS